MPRLFLLTLALFFLPRLVLAAPQPQCPTDDAQGDINLSAEVVRLVLSWNSRECATQKQFPLLQTPKGPLETEGKHSPIALTQQTEVRTLEARRIGVNQVQVRFEVKTPGARPITDELTFLRHTHPRAQNQMGCASVLKYPSRTYLPQGEFCPRAPLPPLK